MKVCSNTSRNGLLIIPDDDSTPNVCLRPGTLRRLMNYENIEPRRVLHRRPPSAFH